MKKYLGIDLGGTQIKGAVVQEDGSILAESTVATEASQGYAHVIHRISSMMEFLSAHQTISGCGIGCPGAVDEKSGEAIYLPNLQWSNVPLRSMVLEETGFSLHLINDANAAALAEAKIGSCKDVNNAIVLTVGTGIGGGVIIDGKIYTGEGIACEPGHMVTHANGHLCSCGRRGCWETYASTTSLLRMASDSIAQYPESSFAHHLLHTSLDGRVIFQLAKEEDSIAQYIVERFYDELALGIANLSALFAPEVIAIGGGISAQGEHFLKSIQEKVQPQFYGAAYLKKQPKLVLCSAGNQAGVIGSAYFAKQCEN